MSDQIYKVRDPTGAIREISGPAGASDEDVIAQAQKLFAAPAPKPFVPSGEKSTIGTAIESSGMKPFLDRLGSGGMVGGSPMGMMTNAAVSGANDLMNKGADLAGRSVTDLAATHMPAKAAGALGAAANVGVSAIPMALGGVGGGLVAREATPAARWTAERLMQIALKPLNKDLLSGKADRAARTYLDEGLNATRGGADALRAKGVGLNQQASQEIANSTATLDRNSIAGRADQTRNQFLKQVDPNEDITAVDAVKNNFLGHPSIVDLGSRERALAEELRTRIASKGGSKASALQDAGRFATQGAQQENLAHGGAINLAPNQTAFGPFNVGAGGGVARSPRAWPVDGMPRVPGRLTNNLERVPEANAAYHDSLVIARQRQAEQEFLKYQLDSLERLGPQDRIPVQLAQELKQGTYQRLKDKYGQMGNAATETQKALARGLKEEIEGAVPSVAPINAKASEIWNALNVGERRALMQGNNSPIGLSPMAHSPQGVIAFLLGRSPLATSLAARGINQAGRNAPAIGGVTGAAATAAALRKRGDETDATRTQ